MKRKKLSKRLLSSLLACSLCLTSAVNFDLQEVHAEEAPGAPVVVSAGGSTWNGTDPVRVYVKADENTAVDSADLRITAGGEKYELKDGFLTLKEGAVPEAGDTVTIGAAAAYYTADQLLWSDGLEEEGSLIPSETGKYCLVHSGKMAHTGLKAGTTTDKNVKDGMWSPQIKSTGRLVFWYYDSGAEGMKEALAGRDSFDQIKFGMAINNYPDLLFGIGVPAKTEKGTGGSTITAAERLEYVDTYTVRDNGNWNRTNIKRTAGWHKMEADVTASGTRLYIDGTPVCLSGETSPLVVSGVKTIEKAAVATNWGDKAEVKEFIQDKHFIDDMYILRPNAGEAKTADISITINVEPADTAADEAAVEAAKSAVESLVFNDVSQANVADEAAALALIETKVAAKLTEAADSEVMVAEAAAEAGAGEAAEADEAEAETTEADETEAAVTEPAEAEGTAEENPAAAEPVEEESVEEIPAVEATPVAEEAQAEVAPVAEAAAEPAGDETETTETEAAAKTEAAVTETDVAVQAVSEEAEEVPTDEAAETEAAAGTEAAVQAVSEETEKVLGAEETRDAAATRSVTVGNVTATVNTVGYQVPEAGSLANPAGVNGFYKFTVTLTKNKAKAVTGELQMNILAAEYTAKEMKLVFGQDDTGALAKGEGGRVFLENVEDYAIADVRYTTDNENVTVDVDGTLTIKPGYAPKAAETVQVTAEVTYYDPKAVVFVDSFEGDKKFTDAASDVYGHSEAGSMFGRKAATAMGSKNGYPEKKLNAVTDVTVTAWYYDANGGADQTKFGFGINNGTDNALGIFYDGTIAAYVNGMTKNHYGVRVPGCTYNDYAWGTTDAARSTGWHKFEWVIDGEKGLTEKIDGKVISTNRLVGKAGTDNNLFAVENYDKVKELTGLIIMDGWSNNATNLGEISNRHFIDGVSVVKNGAATESTTLTSVVIPMRDTTYTVAPETFESGSKYPKAQTFRITPYMENDTDIVKVLVDGKELLTEQWTAGKNEAPVNAANYPSELKGYQVTVSADAFRDLTEGTHMLVMVTAAGAEIPVNFTVKADDHAARDYYLSNGGNDDADGHTPETAWKTFEKLQSVTFGPGDHIYLDANSVWSGVQFRPEGSGAPDSPIVMTKYNDGGDASKRPILNGDGTLADLNAHSYLAFDPWRAFYPSGTIELFNVEQWEVRGIEVTNYKKEMQKGATGRNGIAVIFDYLETQGIEKVPSSNAELEKAYFRAGKMQHVVIEDCYIHDVVGYHPDNGAQGRGGKMSGGINVFGPFDDLQLNNNIVMYCDVEGIRNDVLAWMGDTRTQFPAFMEDVSISNNYIAGVPGDGVVISSANKPVLENNYLTDAGYSYYATSKGKTVGSGVSWSAGNLATCKAVADYTGGVAKDMGNRQAPITLGPANFAGLWFIGTKDAVAQYNEAVNNVWTCNDSEAFDADMFTWGTIFQYNYTYRNNGGFCLFMGSMDDGTLIRYNVSVEDAQSAGISDTQNGLFHYCGMPEAIYNNLFILGDNLLTVFGGPCNETYFYNNIVVAPNGLRDDFHINGSSDSEVANPRIKGEMNNNLFYPAEIPDSSKGQLFSFEKENNIVLKSKEELAGVFEDLDGFMAAQPVKALLGRSDFSGDVVEQLEYGKGAGVAMSAEAGRSVETPTGGFDLEQFAGIKLAEGSPAIGKGILVDRKYDYKAQNDAAFPLTKDFFENDITGMTTVDIGPFQYSSVPQHEHTIVIDEAVEATCTEDGLTEGAHCAVCKEVLKAQEVIPAKGHSWDEGQVTTEPTVDEEGEMTYTCTECHATKTEAIEKLPTEPTEPEEPEKPTEPGDTESPEEPDNKPTEPGDMETPEEPDNKPTEPGDTETPEEPDNKPTEPGDTEKPAEPEDKPSQPGDNGGNNNGGNHNNGGSNNGGSNNGGNHNNGGSNNGGNHNNVGNNNNGNGGSNSGGNHNNGGSNNGGNHNNVGNNNNGNAGNHNNADGTLAKDIVIHVVEKIEAAIEGMKIEVDMKMATIVSKEILETVKGKDVDLVLDMGNYQWTINGNGITEDHLKNLNLEVKTDTNAIPEELVKAQAGECPVTQLSLTHDGTFGFRAVLGIKADKRYSGLYGNLYYYNEQQELEFMGSDLVKEDGSLEFEFTHASDYVIIFDETDAGAIAADEVESTDVADGTLAADGVDAEQSGNASVQSAELQAEKPDSNAGILWLFVALLIAGSVFGVIYTKKKQQSK